MRQFCLIILFCCCWVAVCAQTQRPWRTYKVEKNGKVDSIRWAKDSVTVILLTVRVDSIRTDSGRKHGYRLERREITEEKRVYTSDSVKSTFTISGNIIHVDDSKKNILERKIPVIKHDSAYTYDTTYYPAGSITIRGDTARIIYHINRDTSELNWSKRMNIYNRYYFSKYDKKARLSWGLGYSTALAYRTVLVNDPKFNDPDILEGRADNERLVYGQAFSALVGIALGRTHTIYAEYINMQQGFKSIKSIIDWNTGLPQPATEDRKYRFISNGIGVGYFKSGIDHNINLAADMGLTVLFLNSYSYREGRDGMLKTVRGDDLKKPATAALKRTTLMGKFGIGINCRVSTELTVKVIPTIYYNFTPTSNETLRTRLFNIGFTTGVMFGNKNNRTKKAHKTQKKSSSKPAEPGTTDKPKTKPGTEDVTPKATEGTKKP